MRKVIVVYCRHFYKQMRDNTVPIWQRPLRGHRVATWAVTVVRGAPYPWPRWVGKSAVLAVGLALNAGAALAQQQPASPPQTKAESELNAAWQQVVGAAETAAISGPDQLRAAKAAQGALQAWMAEQRQKAADQAKDAQDKLSASQKDRQTLAAQIANLNKQLAEARKPNPGDQAKIAQLGAELARARQECVRLSPAPGSNSELPLGGMRQPADLPHSTPAPERK